MFVVACKINNAEQTPFPALANDGNIAASGIMM